MSMESWRCRSTVQDQIWAEDINWGVLSKWRVLKPKETETWRSEGKPHLCLLTHAASQPSEPPVLSMTFLSLLFLCTCYSLLLCLSSLPLPWLLLLLQDSIQVPRILPSFPLSSHQLCICCPLVRWSYNISGLIIPYIYL